MVAVKGGAMDCPYTFMQDMVAGGIVSVAVGKDRQDIDGTFVRFAAGRHGCSAKRESGGVSRRPGEGGTHNADVEGSHRPIR